MRKKKLILNKCEIESCNETEFLHLHHIIERTEINTSNNTNNLAILCPCCHAKTHGGKLKIFGILPSTKSPNGRTLIYELNGVKNLDIDLNLIPTIKKVTFKI